MAAQKERIAELKLRFVEQKVSALILGSPGVGKTHIAIGLAMEALNTRSAVWTQS